MRSLDSSTSISPLLHHLFILKSSTLNIFVHPYFFTLNQDSLVNQTFARNCFLSLYSFALIVIPTDLPPLYLFEDDLVTTFFTFEVTPPPNSEKIAVSSVDALTSIVIPIIVQVNLPLSLLFFFFSLSNFASYFVNSLFTMFRANHSELGLFPKSSINLVIYAYYGKQSLINKILVLCIFLQISSRAPFWCFDDIP